MLAPPAFVSELMGLTVYAHIDGVLDDILADEPEARERVRTLLREVMTDEVAHVGQRRNFLGPLGLRAARLMVESMYRAFFRDIPETRLLFNVDQMVRDGKAFDYSTIAPEMLAKSWVPSYCKASSPTSEKGPGVREGEGRRGAALESLWSDLWNELLARVRADDVAIVLRQEMHSPPPLPRRRWRGIRW